MKYFKVPTAETLSFLSAIERNGFSVSGYAPYIIFEHELADINLAYLKLLNGNMIDVDPAEYLPFGFRLIRIE